MSIFRKIKDHFYRRSKRQRKIIIALLIVIVILIGRMTLGSSDSLVSDQEEQLPIVSLLSIADLQEQDTIVQATGEVESVDQVELKSEVSGRINAVYVELGQTVTAGQTLAVLSNADVGAQISQAAAGVQSAQAVLLQYEAQLEAEKATLEELKRGPRPEELDVAYAQLDQLEQAAADAQEGLNIAAQQAQTDVKNALESAMTAANTAVGNGIGLMLTLTDLQYTYYAPGSQKGISLIGAKSLALSKLVGAQDAGKWSKSFILEANGGVKKLVQDHINETDPATVTAINLQVRDALEAVRSALNNIEVDVSFTDADITVLQNAKVSIDTYISTLSGAQQTMDAKLVAADNAVNQATTALNNANNAVSVQQDQVALLLSGASAEQLAAQEASVKRAEATYQSGLAQVRSAQASVWAFQAQYNKTVIRSPIAGEIATLPARVGELASPGTPIASVVNTSGLQVKTFVDSSHVLFIATGNEATINEFINGTVTHVAPSIDPSTKKVEVTVAITAEQENLPVVGQFVDVIIEKKQPEDAIATILLPLEAVNLTNDGSFVFVLDENNVISARSVAIGQVIGGTIEILEGLDESVTILESTRNLEAGQQVQVAQ